jgi:hypothetical protein
MHYSAPCSSCDLVIASHLAEAGEEAAAERVHPCSSLVIWWPATWLKAAEGEEEAHACWARHRKNQVDFAGGLLKLAGVGVGWAWSGAWSARVRTSVRVSQAN